MSQTLYVTLDNTDVFRDASGAAIADGVLVLRYGAPDNPVPLRLLWSGVTGPHGLGSPRTYVLALNSSGQLSESFEIFGCDQFDKAVPVFWQVFSNGSYTIGSTSGQAITGPAAVGPATGQFLSTQDSQPVSLLNHAAYSGKSYNLSRGFWVGQPTQVSPPVFPSFLVDPNKFYGGPDSGVSAAYPSFRELVTADLPSSASLKPATADAIQYVTEEGSDSNDGLSWGTAKASLAAALAALPSVTLSNNREDDGSYDTYTWNHAGTIFLGAGTFTVSSTISISSPFVKIVGQSPSSTVLSYTGSSGACIYWTANPFADEFIGSGGLFDIGIDGFNASAGCIGLETDDISGFNARNVVIRNFSGTNSVGWLDTAHSHFNEKFDVAMILKNNTVQWQINPANTAPGYPTTTFGYGRFNIHMWNYSGQTGLQMVDGALTNSLINLTVNQVANPANASAIVLQNGALFAANVYQIEIESPEGVGTGTEISVPSSSSVFGGVGALNQDTPSSNSYTSGHALPPSGSQFWPVFQTADTNATGNIVFRLDPNGVGQSRQNIIDVTADPPGSYQENQWPSSSGTLALEGANGISAGSLQLSGGTKSHTFATAYSGAPIVVVTSSDTTGETFKVSSSTTGLTITSSNGSSTANVNWIAYPANN